MANKDFLLKNQITEKALINCLIQISKYSNRIKKLYNEEPFFTWEILGDEVLERVIWLYNNSKINIKTGEIIKPNHEINIRIPKTINNIEISLNHQEKTKKHINLSMYAICLKDNEWVSTIDIFNRKNCGIILEKESLGFDDLISVELKKIANYITSILFCAYLSNDVDRGSDLSSLDFKITQVNAKTGKKNIRTFGFLEQINKAKGVLAFELVRIKQGWQIQLIREQAPETIDILTDSYGEYLPFR